MAAAFAQAELRERAAAKFDRAAAMFFTREGLEQASSEVVARHRAERVVPGRVADLCCGIGGDLLALGDGRSATGVDRNPLHAAIAEYNAAAYGVAAGLRAEDVRDADLSGADAVFVDPARRDARGRSPGRSEPPLEWCFGLTDRVPHVTVKAAPGVDIGAIPAGWEVEFVAVGRELKEAVLWSPAYATARTRATVLPGGHVLMARGGPPVDTAPPSAYLVDPSPAVTRAGAVEDLARLLGARKIDERIAFLTTDGPVRTPYGRCLQVLESMPWRLPDIKAAVRRHEVGTLDVRRRGLAGDVDDIRRRLRLAGPVRAVLVMTRVANRPWALLCLPVDGERAEWADDG